MRQAGVLHKPVLMLAIACEAKRGRVAGRSGLPTFMDLSRSFSAGAVVEDNLVAQLRSSGRRLVRALQGPC